LSGLRGDLVARENADLNATCADLRDPDQSGG
jgi:hypothetical protein